MAAGERAYRHADLIAKGRPARTSEAVVGDRDRRADPAAGTRAGGFVPGSLTPAGILWLQRMAGNRAVSGLLAEIAQRQADRQRGQVSREASAHEQGTQQHMRPVPVQRHATSGTWSGALPALQRAKDEDARRAKHRRVALAKRTIAELGGKLKGRLKGHIFDALTADGSALDKANPTGLHAYTNGALPAGIERVTTVGSQNGIHTLTWRWAGKPTKDSTMFPIWMPPTHVSTLIALKFPDVREGAVDAKKIAPEATRTYISRGLTIKLKQAGDTVYPEQS